MDREEFLKRIRENQTKRKQCWLCRTWVLATDIVPTYFDDGYEEICLRCYHTLQIHDDELEGLKIQMEEEMATEDYDKEEGSDREPEDSFGNKI